MSTSVTYCLAICDLFHPALHGQDDKSSHLIETQFLINNIVELNDFYSHDDADDADDADGYKEDIKFMRRNVLKNNIPHPIIRNYKNINKKHIRLEIVKTDVLTPGGEYVAYFKTFGLRIVQRRWKNIFQARKKMLAERKTIKAINERQRTGQWPKHLREWPLFRLNLLN